MGVASVLRNVLLGFLSESESGEIIKRRIKRRYCSPSLHPTVSQGLFVCG